MLASCSTHARHAMERILVTAMKSILRREVELFEASAADCMLLNPYDMPVHALYPRDAMARIMKIS
jgi:hypothetical protein